MHQATLNNGAEVHFDSGVLDIPGDLGARLELQEIARMDRSDHGAVDYHVGHRYLALDTSVLTQHQGGRLAIGGANITADFTIDAQTPAESHITRQGRARADQAVDSPL
jgi:hypothetical protein